MLDDAFPVEWTGRQAVVLLPEHIDVSNVGQIREQLLSVINRGAAVLIADMTATMSCDHAGADAVVRAYQRGVVSGTQLRLVVTAPIVRRTLALSGLDRLVSIYPSLEAAAAARKPGEEPEPDPARAAPQAGFADRQDPRAASPAIAPAVLLELLDALKDGLVLTDDNGVIALANRRLEDMFGYDHDELAGRPIESLLPADLRAGHIRDRAGYLRAPATRPMGARARLVGLRKDGATIPVQITLSPVPTATAHFTLAVVRDAAETEPPADLASLARLAAGEGQQHRGWELLDSVIGRLHQVGLSLHAAMEQPGDVARKRIAEALRRLDDTIGEIQAHALTTTEHRSPADRGGANGTSS